ncbi:SPARC-related modular calcium-binding protein 1-like isoform X2 [Haliotis rufescens]|uniref:SPARC-related modular calcium-binding protein 1-like isoform X2 n=1 Tax=Haliotis rufescens TaxID=6454 RepID=UPI00201EC4A0|nr:SPARC-related modular calcium-binding protein 1-like isoform X2 [Haliotis rufescens]
MDCYIRWSFCVLFITVIYMCVVTPASPQLSEVDGKSLFRSLRASNCKEDCSSVATRPVCGTDGKTYLSRCELKKAKKCDGRRVKVRKKGHCSAGAEDGGARSYEGRCPEERAQAMESAKQDKSVVFVPVCSGDGTFAEVQCHATGYCWCSTKDGHHIPGTSVKDRRPRCGRGRRKKRKPGKKRKKKPCTPGDRLKFNTALVGEFTQEHNRVKSSDQTPPTPSPSASESQVEREKKTVEWKFAQLDKDNDKRLKFKEIRSFVRMVKKLIKPKACAKTFLNNCDSNPDRHIEMSEWTLCLGIDIKYSFRLFISLNSDGRTTEPSVAQKKQDTFFQSRPVWNPALTLANTPEPKKHRKRPERTYTNKSCVEEREAALTQDSQEPNANIYIPRCQEDGKWTKAQCHEATQYCWCVEEATGMPIPGTSTHAVEPNCSISEDRPMKGEWMKGCPLSQKRRFLADLMADLSEEKRAQGANASAIRSPLETKGLSELEMVARWKLATLDANSNGILERKEWKKLRKTNLKNKKYPRKCRRNFLRYCDANSDQRVEFDEWKDCLGLNRKDNYNVLPGVDRRGKKNPFMDQLT